MRVAIVSLIGLAACSWSAFDTLGKDTPVTAFTNRAAGARVAVATDPDGRAFLALGGAPPDGTRFYAIGDGRAAPGGSPLTNAANCELRSEAIVAGSACMPTTTLAAVGPIRDGQTVRPACFAIGYGRGAEGGSAIGPVVQCTDGTVYTLGPAPADSALATAFEARNETAIRGLELVVGARAVATGRNPSLILSNASEGRVFAYPEVGQGAAAVEIGRPTEAQGGRFGATVAIARAAGDEPRFVVGAPGSGRLFAFGGDPLAVVECWSGSPSLGDALATGDVDGDGLDEILVRDGDVVRLLKPASGTGTCAPIPASAPTFRCSEERGLGCAGADFGRAIAVGDLDAAPPREIAIGAPAATVDGVAQTGAVLIFDPGGALRDLRALGDLETGAGYGGALAIGAVAAQDTLFVGARGKGAGYAVWCPALPATPAGPRCRR
jgi:hypothetical protein